MDTMTTQCADGVTGCTPATHAGGGGSIPTSALHFAAGQRDEAKRLVMRYHYSRRMPANVQFIGTWHMPGGLFGDMGEAVAAVLFSIPPTRWGEPVLELTRLVRADNVQIPLSRLIGYACRWLRTAGADLVVSFADRGEGHHGGVYQAAGWQYGGLRGNNMDGLVVNGGFVPGRTCNSIYGTQSPTKLANQHPAWTIDPHYDIGKHLYWRALGRRGKAKAARLKLGCLPYPKGAPNV